MSVVLALALVASIGLVVNLHGDHDHWPALGGWARPLELLAVAACVMMAIAILRRRRGAEHAARPGRLAFYVLSLTWLSTLFHDYEQGGAYYSFIIGFGVLATLDAFGPALRRAIGPRVTDAIDLVCMNVCVLFVGLELCLRLVAAFVHAPLFAQDSSDAKGWLAANKLEPGTAFLGFPVNSHGFPDDEFAHNQGCLVAAVGDSFTVGLVVPHELHFTTVAERALGCPIDAIGVCAVGPEEYQLLERDEALPLDPNVVLVDLFVGNDIVDNLRGRDHFRGGMRRWLDRHNMLVYELPRRLAIVARERRRLHAPPVVAASAPSKVMTHGELVQAFPWLTDPAREPPSMSHEAYLELETRHGKEICGGGDEAYYKRFWEILDEMRAAAAPRTLAVLLIPDELQVEDPLWREVGARAGVPLDRDRAQRILAARLKEKGIPALDLLPILRAQPVGPDGMRHLFHRDDSHLNARGNAVVGEALAGFLRPLIPAR